MYLFFFYVPVYHVFTFRQTTNALQSYIKKIQKKEKQQKTKTSKKHTEKTQTNNRHFYNAILLYFEPNFRDIFLNPLPSTDAVWKEKKK